MNETPFIRRQLPYRFYNVTLTLIILNVALFLINMLFPLRSLYYLALIPSRVIESKAYWQVVTYMFVHGGTFHILFNMLALFIFGTQLERKLGSTEFLIYYLVTGVGAGLFTLVFNWFKSAGSCSSFCRYCHLFTAHRHPRRRRPSGPPGRIGIRLSLLPDQAGHQPYQGIF